MKLRKYHRAISPTYVYRRYSSVGSTELHVTRSLNKDNEVWKVGHVLLLENTHYVKSARD